MFESLSNPELCVFNFKFSTIYVVNKMKKLKRCIYIYIYIYIERERERLKIKPLIFPMKITTDTVIALLDKSFQLKTQFYVDIPIMRF